MRGVLEVNDPCPPDRMQVAQSAHSIFYVRLQQIGALAVLLLPFLPVCFQVIEKFPPARTAKQLEESSFPFVEKLGVAGYESGFKIICQDGEIVFDHIADHGDRSGGVSHFESAVPQAVYQVVDKFGKVLVGSRFL